MYRAFGGRIILSSAYRRWKASVALATREQVAACGGFGSALVEVDIDAVFKTRRSDLDNVAKPVIDALAAAGWVGNDNQVIAIRLRKVGYSMTRPEVFVTMRPSKMTPAKLQR